MQIIRVILTAITAFGVLLVSNVALMAYSLGHYRPLRLFGMPISLDAPHHGVSLGILVYMAVMIVGLPLLNGITWGVLQSHYPVEKIGLPWKPMLLSVLALLLLPHLHLWFRIVQHVIPVLISHWRITLIVVAIPLILFGLLFAANRLSQRQPMPLLHETSVTSESAEVSPFQRGIKTMTTTALIGTLVFSITAFVVIVLTGSRGGSFGVVDFSGVVTIWLLIGLLVVVSFVSFFACLAACLKSGFALSASLIFAFFALILNAFANMLVFMVGVMVLHK